MALFNQSKSSSSKTVNLAGGEAYRQSAKMELATLLLTSFGQDQYYRNQSGVFKKLQTLLSSLDPLFAAKAAVFARRQYGMRSITHYAAAAIAPYIAGRAWAKDFYRQIVYRPDDMLEIAACYFHLAGKRRMLPNAMRKGFAKAFDQFNAYQLAKYRGEKKTVKLIDIVNAAHPVPTEKNAEALRALVNGQLRNEETWEAQLTAAGQNAIDVWEKQKQKKEVWIKLLREGKLGYFALVRNLRNILAQAPEAVPLACKQLTDPKRIKRSLVLPFRLYVAYKQLKGASPLPVPASFLPKQKNLLQHALEEAFGVETATEKDVDSNQNNKSLINLLKTALNQAIDIACDNIPALPNTLVVIDNSGSMDAPVSNSKHMKCNEAGALFGIAMAKACQADLMEFGTTARYIPYPPDQSVFAFSRSFAANNQVGQGTNFHSIFEEARRAYDRIVIFSDMQGWIGYASPVETFNNYKKRTGARPFIYSVDLRTYGSLQFPENQVFCLAGFSEKIFDVMQVLEKDPQALITAIEATPLGAVPA